MPLRTEHKHDKTMVKVVHLHNQKTICKKPRGKKSSCILTTVLPLALHIWNPGYGCPSLLHYNGKPFLRFHHDQSRSAFVIMILGKTTHWEISNLAYCRFRERNKVSSNSQHSNKLELAVYIPVQREGTARFQNVLWQFSNVKADSSHL